MSKTIEAKIATAEHCLGIRMKNNPDPSLLHTSCPGCGEVLTPAMKIENDEGSVQIWRIICYWGDVTLEKDLDDNGKQEIIPGYRHGNFKIHSENL